MSLNLCDFDYSDADYAAVLNIWNTVWPDLRENEDRYRYNDTQRNPDHFFQRVVVERDGEVVGYGIYSEMYWVEAPGTYNLSFMVLPRYRRQGIGTWAFHEIERRLEPHRPRRFGAGTREDQAEGRRFLERHGFKLVMRAPRSELDTAEFDFSRYAALPAKLEKQGIEIITMSEFEQRFGPEWARHLDDLGWEIEKDVPSPHPPSRRPHEDFLKMLNHPDWLPEGTFIALDGKTPVGLSNLWNNSNQTDRYRVGITGVIRSHRRRGIGTALKLRTIAYTQQTGRRYIDTDNEENNPMYALNMQLGFKPLPAWLDYEKEVGAARNAA